MLSMVHGSCVQAIYVYFLSEETRSQVEATGRAVVEADEKGFLSVTKRAHAMAVGVRARPS